MVDAMWRPSQQKYGVAIYSYKGSESHMLPLQVGETVHILEEYFHRGSESILWYRGMSMKNKDSMGIFPVCVICTKPCGAENPGQYETITPNEDIMVREISYVLQEWRVKWRELFVTNKQSFHRITASMTELLSLRGQLVDRKLTQEDAQDVRQDIVSVIDWGNCQLGMDLVPRIEGEQVDPDKCSIVQLYRLHKNSAQIAETDMPLRKQRLTAKSSRTEMALEAGISSHHLLVSFKNFGCNVGDSTETLLSLYHYRDNKLVSLCEKFLVRHTKQSAPEDLEKLNNYYGLFTDLSNDDIEKDIFLVAHIYRLGGMKPENSKKSHKTAFKRPWGVGVHILPQDKLTSMNMTKLPANNKEWEFQMKVACCTDNENEFTTLHEQLIKRVQHHGIASGIPVGAGAAKLGLTLTMSVQLLNGDLATVKKEDPMLFSKGVAQIQKIGFSEVISPGEVRNDFYVTLKSAELDRGNKKSQKNVEVKVTVLDESLKPIKDCIVYGCGDPAKPEYKSSVFYHNNKPEWNETIRISVPIEIFPGSHIFFELYHCSVSKNSSESGELYGVAFVNVTNQENIVLRNDTHRLCLYKHETSRLLDKKGLFTCPFLLDNDDNTRDVAILAKNNVKCNERESLTISTLLCSGKFTQNGDLLGILNWRGEQFRKNIPENLIKLNNMQGEEIVKFMHDILDALFEMLGDPGTKEHNDKIFLQLINIFTLMHHSHFVTFKPMLESYITDVFSAPLVHKPLCVCFAGMIHKAIIEESKMNTQLIQSFQDMDYIFRFIVQSRHIQLKDVFSHGSNEDAEFKRNLEWIFQNMAKLLSLKSKKLETYQVQLLKSLHLTYVPLLDVQSTKDVASFLKICFESMPQDADVADEIVQAKLSLLNEIVQTKLFKSDESRAILLPIFIKEISTCLDRKVHTKLTADLLADMMDSIFRLKQDMCIKVDILKIVHNMFDIIMNTIVHLECESSFANRMHKARLFRKKGQKKVRRSHTHVGVSIKYQTKDSSSQRNIPDTIAKEPPQITKEEPVIKKTDIDVSASTIYQSSTVLSNTLKRSIDTYRSSSSVSALFSKVKGKVGPKDKGYQTLEFLKPTAYVIGAPSPISETADGKEMTVKPYDSIGLMIACLMELLRLMEDDHFDDLLHVYHRRSSLHMFLINILRVFKVLVQPEIFPSDWAVMRMVSNSVVFQAMNYFSHAIKENFITNDKFNVQIWSDYFNLAVAFIIQPSLQLDRYSEVKANKLRERYQDMRVSMCQQVESLWQALDRFKENFIPNMVGPFVELTLVPEEDVRKATLPIIYDMIEFEQMRKGNFKQVEAVLIERLDYFLTQRHNGDVRYKDLFKQMLLERMQQQPNLSENGTKFVISVTNLLERLLDYRHVVEGDENKDKHMYTTFNILNFYRDEINRQEMYIRYVNKLHELHMGANNHAEAGLTLQLYAGILDWLDEELPAEMHYRRERECDRKETLYTQIISCFDQGKVWEYALPMCKDLAVYYESRLDYKKLANILKQLASFYGKILEGVPVPSDNPSEPETHYPRQDPSYYRVAYYGKSFPTSLRNKQFIYRGDECLKLATFMNHVTSEFPAATILSNNPPQNDDLKDSEKQFIQICILKPVPKDRPEFNNKDVPFELRNFYNFNDVDTFQFDRPYHRGAIDKNNEYKTLCIERAKMKSMYRFPGILRWYEVVAMETEQLCPIVFAIETLKQSNNDLTLLINRCLMNQRLYFSQLEMRLQGIINAAVNGGITKYHEAFFTKEFESQHPDEIIYLDELQAVLAEQIPILQRGMDVHLRLVPPNLQPLHLSLDGEFKKMKKAVLEDTIVSCINTKTILVRHLPGCRSRGRPRRRWTQDIKDFLHMTGVEAGHLAGDQHCFGMAVMKRTRNVSTSSLRTPTTPGPGMSASGSAKIDSPPQMCGSTDYGQTGSVSQQVKSPPTGSATLQNKLGKSYVPLPGDYSSAPPPPLPPVHRSLSAARGLVKDASPGVRPPHGSCSETSLTKPAGSPRTPVKVFRRETVADAPPKMPTKRRPSVPTVPTCHLPVYNNTDPETAQEHFKLQIPQKPASLNGLMNFPSVPNVSIPPPSNIKSPLAGPLEIVPPLPPRKQSINPLSQSANMQRFDKPSVEQDRTASVSDDYSSSHGSSSTPERGRAMSFSKDLARKGKSASEQTTAASSFLRDASPSPSAASSPQLTQRTPSFSKDHLTTLGSLLPEQKGATSLSRDSSPSTNASSQERERTNSFSKDLTRKKGSTLPEKTRTSLTFCDTTTPSSSSQPLEQAQRSFSRDPPPIPSRRPSDASRTTLPLKSPKAQEENDERL